MTHPTTYGMLCSRPSPGSRKVNPGMGCLIECHRPTAGYELAVVREIDERLESDGIESDNRVRIDNAHIIVDTVGDGLSLSLLGESETNAICITVTGPTVFSVGELFNKYLCTIFKVVEPPF